MSLFYGSNQINMSVLTDSSDDENDAMLREAVDSTLFNDDMFKDFSKNKSDRKAAVVEQLKSQRYLANEEQQVDVRVSASMQCRIGKKVSEIIDSQIKFVDVKLKVKPEEPEIEGGIKLFRDSAEYLTPALPEEVLLSKEKRKKIKKRCLNDDSVDSEMSKDEMLSSVAVTSDEVINGADMEHWLSRRKPKVNKYKKSKKGRVLTSLDDV